MGDKEENNKNMKEAFDRMLLATPEFNLKEVFITTPTLNAADTILVDKLPENDISCSS